MRQRLLQVLLCLGTIPALASRVDAQVDEALITKRWKTDNFWAETYDRPYVTARGEIEGSDEHFMMFHWISQGRIKFDRADLHPPVWLGYRADTVSINSDRELLDHPFADVALGAGVQLGSIGSGWMMAAGAGVGTANDGRWDNPHAVYGTATLDFARTVASEPTWHVGLTYDGNRSVLEAVPLPYFQVETAPDPSLTLLLGFPKAEIVWRPWGPLTLSAEWQLATQASARVDVDLGAGFTTFAAVLRRIDGFHLRDQERTRLFWEVHTVEVGARWVTSWLDVGLSVGTTFGQRYFEGPDVLDRTRGDSIDRLPFIALTLPGASWAPPLSAGLHR
ncbi:MAG: hypothetical protein JO332_01885 [Planctomycetaceae bacterium]|nr:hypothetical protein [Planctomycetaceae bacterium]